jgi:hypothetical protein
MFVPRKYNLWRACDVFFSMICRQTASIFHYRPLSVSFCPLGLLGLEEHGIFVIMLKKMVFHDTVAPHSNPPHLLPTHTSPYCT